MKTALVAGVVVTVALPLSACASAGGLSPVATTTVATTVMQVPGSPAPPPDAVTVGEWTAGPDGTGLFAVGAHGRDGMAAIPQGSYEVRVAPGAESGDWMLCDTALCGPLFPQNAAVAGHATAPGSTAIFIGSKARTMWVDNVVLSPVDSEDTATALR